MLKAATHTLAIAVGATRPSDMLLFFPENTIAAPAIPTAFEAVFAAQ
ncbi:hypothetical protein [Pontivivens ytuae]|uniref:Uncharacterized protein n=1 Tax=Pontivivens ytuae TaxID=2789856 RepID=A0A7S9QCV6_9RHOB|nr:hypothetical protein [Pontivivens ytuae]QPH54230.1 hypothetical protein I0K15_00175 [Pontivivens ytuae]